MVVSWPLIVASSFLRALLGTSIACNDSRSKTQDQDLAKYVESA
jgi:hypothetical protein